MGLFSKRSADPAEIEHLRGEIAAMHARLEASESAKDALGNRVAEVAERLDRSTPPPPAPPPRTVDPADIDRINDHIAHLDSRLAERIDDRMATITERIDDLDRRITSISTELANQIAELSGELDAVTGDTPPTAQVVGELRDAQTQLANEQARYQIAFRHDLAELAELLKKA